MSLSSDDLTRIRATAESILTQTCTIYRNTISADGDGGWSESTETSVGTDVPCRLAVSHAVVSSELDQRRERVSAYHEYVLKLAYDQAVEPNDEVVIGSERYRVEAVLDEHQWMTIKRCKLARIQ